MTFLFFMHFTFIPVSTFTPTCVISKRISLPKISRMWVHKGLLSCLFLQSSLLPSSGIVVFVFEELLKLTKTHFTLKSWGPVLQTGNNGTFSQQRAMAVRDQNINKAKWRAPREGCLVWKPTEIIEECGIMKMAYLIIWYLKYVSFSFLISVWPPSPFFCVGFVCQWVWGLWTWRVIPAPQLLVGSTTPRLWREGEACGFHALIVSVAAVCAFSVYEGASFCTPQCVFFVCVTLLPHTVLRGITQHYNYSTSICCSWKLNISLSDPSKLKTDIFFKFVVVF